MKARLILRTLACLVLASISAALAATGCAGSATSNPPGKTYSGQGPMDIVCTTGMVADLAQNIGGPHVRITQLMRAGVDPHLYKASPGDIQSLNQADLILYSGKHLEGKMADLLANLSRTRRTAAVTDGIPDPDLLKTEEGVVDPHLWFDVSLWQRAAATVRDVLVDFDPPHAQQYRSRWQAYDSRLAELHRQVKVDLERIPIERRVLVTAHDAFRYFGKAYSIEVKSIQGISTESEASVKQVNELVDYIVNRRIKAVFVETSVSEKNIKALVEGCAARGHAVIIGGELYSDAMGPPGSGAETYIGMVQHNVATITKALH